MRIFYDVESLTVGGVAYLLFIQTNDTTADYFTYDPDILTIVSGAVYAKVTATGGEVADLLPATPVEGNLVEELNLLYSGASWWHRVG